MAANEYELNDTRDAAYGPLAGGTSYTASLETENDEDWYVFYIKTYSQMDFSATMVKTWGFRTAVPLHIYNKDGESVENFRAGYVNVTNHLLLTMNPGRYYIRVRHGGDTAPGDRYRFRIDPAASITTSRECGEAIVAKDAVAPALVTVNQELAEKGRDLATKAAAVHAAKKELRQASSTAKRLRQKMKRLKQKVKLVARRGIDRKRNRARRKLTRVRGPLRRVRGEVVKAAEQLDKAKAKRRPVWQEKRNLESAASQHQQALAGAEGQIATHC